MLLEENSSTTLDSPTEIIEQEISNIESNEIFPVEEDNNTTEDSTTTEDSVITESNNDPENTETIDSGAIEDLGDLFNSLETETTESSHLENPTE